MPKHLRGFVSGFVEQVQASGRLTFSLADIAASGPLEGRALEAALRRHAANGAIRRVSRRSDFFVIVPPEYRQMGAPPVDWWLGDLMTHLELPYYVGLLSAAQRQGASPFAVMEIQVITPRQMKPLVVGRSRIRWFVKAGTAKTPVEQRRNPWGSILISSPEATLLDLLRYSVVGIEEVIMIARDLRNQCRGKTLDAALEAAGDVPSAQRLGYLFEQLGDEKLASQLEGWLSGRSQRPVALVPGGPNSAQLSLRWRVTVNANLEV